MNNTNWIIKESYLELIRVTINTLKQKMQLFGPYKINSWEHRLARFDVFSITRSRSASHCRCSCLHYKRRWQMDTSTFIILGCSLIDLYVYSWVIWLCFLAKFYPEQQTFSRFLSSFRLMICYIFLTSHSGLLMHACGVILLCEILLSNQKLDYTCTLLSFCRL